MKMSFDSWVKNSWLERLQSDAPEIARLLALADGRLADYEKAVTAKLSPDVQLGLAYDAIRVCGTAALRAAGYRVIRGNNEHYRTIEALEFSIGKRNVGSYDDYGLVSQGEADACGKMAVRMRKDVEGWIRKNYPDKLG